MNYAKALRLVRAFRGFSAVEAGDAWEALEPVGNLRLERFSLIEALEAGLEPTDEQLRQLSRVYKIDEHLWPVLALETADLSAMDSQSQNYCAARVLHFIAGEAP